VLLPSAVNPRQKDRQTDAPSAVENFPLEDIAQFKKQKKVQEIQKKKEGK